MNGSFDDAEWRELWNYSRNEVVAKVKNDADLIEQGLAEIEVKHKQDCAVNEQAYLAAIAPWALTANALDEYLLLLRKTNISDAERARESVLNAEIKRVVRSNPVFNDKLRSIVADEKRNALERDGKKFLKSLGVPAFAVEGKTVLLPMSRVTFDEVYIELQCMDWLKLAVHDKMVGLKKQYDAKRAEVDAASDSERIVYDALKNDVLEKKKEHARQYVSALDEVIAAEKLHDPSLVAIYRCVDAKQVSAEVKQFSLDAVKALVEHEVNKNRLAQQDALWLFYALEGVVGETVLSGDDTDVDIAASMVSHVSESRTMRLAEIVGDVAVASAMAEFCNLEGMEKSVFKEYVRALETKITLLRAAGLYDEVNPIKCPDLFASRAALEQIAVHGQTTAEPIEDTINSELSSAGYDVEAVHLLINAFRPKTKKFIGHAYIPEEAVWGNIPQAVQSDKGQVLRATFDVLVRECVIMKKPGSKNAYSLNGDVGKIKHKALHNAAAYHLGK